MAWRATSSFLCCVLWPLCWAGLLTAHQAQGDKRSEAACFKTPLWPAWLTLDTDNMVEPAPTLNETLTTTSTSVLKVSHSNSSVPQTHRQRCRQVPSAEAYLSGVPATEFLISLLYQLLSGFCVF